MFMNVASSRSTASLEANDVEAERAEVAKLVLELVTSPEYTEVGQPSGSGTCGSVTQQFISSLPSTRPVSRVCMQSKIASKSVMAEFPFSPAIEQIAADVKLSGAHWEDAAFPAAASSIYPGNRPSYLPAGIEWKRPCELVKNPSLVTEGVTRFDINQGRLGNCWFLATVAALTQNQQIMDRVLPAGQSLSRDQGYTGAIHFR